MIQETCTVLNASQVSTEQWMVYASVSTLIHKIINVFVLVALFLTT